ncbi:FAD-binding oxidoreductase [Pseudoflavitalea sp. X16]|uniref:FAD-binding oxidoreductase n=1 Tax=Paraflavitalea devenefica TaxID=2716334 RepID=UPI0014230A39|nr:FAD-binding oxidoreductase [Paraflavitalea devenefica]NII25539.1 FAD-binding oxidoreductase [Paraflavitalea devenefica]
MSLYKQEKLAGWGNYPVSESYVLPVRDAGDVAGALERGTLIARGLGRSYGDQAVNDHCYVGDCTKLNRFLAWDAAEGILECEAGVSLEEIITVFAPRGWLPMICPGTKFVTIGGAIANDIHGKAHHIDGSFANCVLSFTILLADGRVLTASRTEHADLFQANFGGLGLLGVILTARLQLRKVETTYFKQQSIKIRDLDHMLEALDSYDADYNYSVAWIDALAKGPKLGSGVLTLGNAAQLADLPPSLRKEPLKLHKNSKLTVPFFLPSFTLNNVTVRVLNRVIAFVQNSSKTFIHYEKFFFPLDAIHHWNRGYGKRGFVQYQFVIPETNGRQHLAEILTMIAQSGCTPFLNVFKRMGEGQGILSFPFKGYTLAIDFPVSKALFAFTPKLDAKVLAAGGRLYLGKDALLTETMFKAMYPQYEEWVAVKRKYDPEGKFSSNIGRRLGLIGTSTLHA